MNSFNLIAIISIMLFGGNPTPSEKVSNDEYCVKFRTEVFKSSEDKNHFEIIHKTCTIDSFSVTVYDKFGDEVYHASKFDFKWNLIIDEMEYNTEDYLAFRAEYKPIEKDKWESQTGEIKIY